MISPNAKLSIRRIPLSQLIVCEFESRYLERLILYIEKMNEHPRDYAGLMSVVPSNVHPGMYAILDGYTRFCASIMTGRRDALCLVIEEEEDR